MLLRQQNTHVFHIHGMLNIQTNIYVPTHIMLFAVYYGMAFILILKDGVYFIGIVQY